MEPLVTIIVPVYNAEKYLRRCVDSILGQDYSNFRLLLMDDGSTDSSPQICDSYADRDARVQTVHKENTGVSDTRNQALDMAQGTYIQFLDSDDWIVPEATRLLVSSMEQYHCDMVISDFYRVSGERLAPKGDIENDGVMSRQEFAACMIENPADFYYGVLWNKLFKREIIEKHRIRMDVTISWCEDFLFNLEYIRHANAFYALKVPIYYYRKRKDSLVNMQGMSISNTVRMKINVFEYYNEFYKDIYDDEDYADIKMQVYSFFWSAAKDGAVVPVLPGTKKLGEERRQILREDIEGDGAVISQYRFHRLFEYELELTAQKNNLTKEEALLLCTLYQSLTPMNVRRLAELTDIAQPKLFFTMQSLERKKLIDTVTDKEAAKETGKEAARDKSRDKAARKEKKAKEKGAKEKTAKDKNSDKAKDEEKKDRTRILLRPEADRICADFDRMKKELEQVCFAGFTEKEMKQNEEFIRRVADNMIRFMVREVPEEDGD